MAKAKDDFTKWRIEDTEERVHFHFPRALKGREILPRVLKRLHRAMLRNGECDIDIKTESRKVKKRAA